MNLFTLFCLESKWRGTEIENSASILTSEIYMSEAICRRFFFWELECWQIVSWEPEGRYCCTKSMAIAPFWFSTEHRWSAITPFWLSTDEMSIQKRGVWGSNTTAPLPPPPCFFFFFTRLLVREVGHAATFSGLAQNTARGVFHKDLSALRVMLKS